MADLSKIKLNGVEYNIKDTVARNMISPPLATETTDGLLSADDKRLLNSLNPNIVKTISNLNASEFGIINAKQNNALGLDIAVEPTISQQIRTINLLDVNSYTPGFYIGANGNLASNTNDHVGDFIPVSPGDDIYYTGIIGPTNSGSINRRLHVYTANQTWIKQISFASNLKVGNSWSTHGVIPANGAYVRVSWGVEDTNVMITIGAPDKYYPYYMTPFTATNSVNFKVGHTNDPEDATTYTFNIPAAAGSLYGLEFDPIKGKLWKVTEHIASYNGETLPGHWLSDRDIYVEGTTPQIGAEVVYRLADEDIVEYDCTPMVIPLNYHENYFFIENGMFMELSYYAATLAVDHLTIYSGATFGDTNILETDVIGWNKAAELIDTKADLVGAQLTGNVTAPTLGIAANSDRIATTAFVQSMLHTLAPFETTAKASKNYEVGDYVYILGTLYKVTAAVPQNGTLTVGTNIVATTVMDEMESKGDIFVHITSQGNTYTSDTTYDDIITAIQKDQTVFAKMDREGGNFLLIEVESSYVRFKKSHKQTFMTDSRNGSVIPCLNESIIQINKNGTVSYTISGFINGSNNNNEIIEIVDGNGDYFESADDLTTANASSIRINFPGWEIWEWPIFWENSKVRVGTMTESNISDFWYSDTSRSCELYDCVKTEITKNIEDPDRMITHTGTFRTLSMRNGNPVIKTIIITAHHQEYTDIDYSNDISVTYSEIALSS